MNTIGSPSVMFLRKYYFPKSQKAKKKKKKRREFSLLEYNVKLIFTIFNINLTHQVRNQI